MISYGQIAYEAYCTHSGYKSLVSGTPLPAWTDMDRTIQECWQAAAEAIVMNVDI